jgi:hypothetical protein
MINHTTIQQRDPILANIEAAHQEIDPYLKLQHACIAIESTAKKFYKIDPLGRTKYIKFIENYSWILSATSPGIDFEKTVFTNLKIKNDKGEEVLNPKIGDVVYYTFRCPSAHGAKINDNFAFSESNEFMMDVTGKLHMPTSFVWGLIFICVFAETNSDITSDGILSLSYQGNLKHASYSFNPTRNTKFDFFIKDSYLIF